MSIFDLLFVFMRAYYSVCPFYHHLLWALYTYDIFCCCRAHFNSLVACNSSLLYSLPPRPSLPAHLCVVSSFFIIYRFSLFMCVLIAQSYFWYIWQLSSAHSASPRSFSLSLQKAFMNFYYPYNPSERDTHTHTLASLVLSTHIDRFWDWVYWKFGGGGVVSVAVGYCSLLPSFLYRLCHHWKYDIANIVIVDRFWWPIRRSYTHIYCHFSCRCLSDYSFITTHNPSTCWFHASHLTTDKNGRGARESRMQTRTPQIKTAMNMNQEKTVHFSGVLIQWYWFASRQQRYPNFTDQKVWLS